MGSIAKQSGKWLTAGHVSRLDSVHFAPVKKCLLNQLQRKTASSAEHSLGSYCELARKLVEGFTRAHEELQSMQYRAMLIGATFDISTIPTGGTLVSCSIQESSR